MKKHKLPPKEGDLPTLTIEQCRELEDKILQTWERRREAQGYDKKHKKTKDLQREFLLGMTAVFDCLTRAHETGNSSISPKVFMGVIRGEYIK